MAWISDLWNRLGFVDEVPALHRTLALASGFLFASAAYVLLSGYSLHGNSVPRIIACSFWPIILMPLMPAKHLVDIDGHTYFERRVLMSYAVSVLTLLAPVALLAMVLGVAVASIVISFVAQTVSFVLVLAGLDFPTAAIDLYHDEYMSFAFNHIPSSPLKYPLVGLGIRALVLLIELKRDNAADAIKERVEFSGFKVPGGWTQDEKERLKKIRAAMYATSDWQPSDSDIERRDEARRREEDRRATEREDAHREWMRENGNRNTASGDPWPRG